MDRSPLLLALALGACFTKPRDSALVVIDDDDEVPYEGDGVGECGDDADNDRDGYFDCDDNGCWGSDGCGGSGEADADSDTDNDTDTDTDSDTDSDTDTDTDTDTDSDTDSDNPAASLTSFELTYTLEWDFDDAYDEVIESWGLGDCTTTYRASGDQVEASGTQVTFYGPWAADSTASDCASDLMTAIWYSTSTEEAHATFRFNDSMTALDDWLEHRDLEDTEPLSDPSSKAQWYITSMDAAYGGPGVEVTHSETETTSIEGLIPLDLIHTVNVTFSE